jgi:hypothetical protein
MKLSEAMMLGSVTCKMIPGDWNSCALGCAGNAIGIPKSVMLDGLGRAEAIRAYWPWLAKTSQPYVPWSEEIWQRFDKGVCEGEMTMEQLADYVRSVEPSCGECNVFQCSCPKTAAVTEHQTEQVTA